MSVCFRQVDKRELAKGCGVVVDTNFRTNVHRARVGPDAAGRAGLLEGSLEGTCLRATSEYQREIRRS